MTKVHTLPTRRLLSKGSDEEIWGHGPRRGSSGVAQPVTCKESFNAGTDDTTFQGRIGAFKAWDTNTNIHLKHLDAPVRGSTWEDYCPTTSSLAMDSNSTISSPTLETYPDVCASEDQ
jgi:hypothetical protein